MGIQVTKLNNFFGAQIDGLDIADTSEDLIEELKSLWLEHKVLVIRDQHVSTQTHVDFSRRFGELEIHPFATKLPDYPEVLVLEAGGPTGKKKYSASDWHSDVTYREKPPMGSILRGKVIPAVGGDTCLADAAEAYNRLDEETKSTVDGLFAEHDWIRANRSLYKDHEIEALREMYPLMTHPVIRTHPETGDRVIFTNIFFTLHIKGIEENESNRILRKLENAIRDASIQIRVRWDLDTFVMWDNRCVQHSGTDDFLPDHRRMERTTIIGDRPY
ncbi:MAG: TauD/TfdA family dioxygenase [Acidimicrobiales bacterium]|nr:TauD/TfdA family dioxygenase [Acidimicrobiales bacterium]